MSGNHSKCTKLSDVKDIHSTFSLERIVNRGNQSLRASYFYIFKISEKESHFL